jgi:hypothetical protein
LRWGAELEKEEIGNEKLIEENIKVDRALPLITAEDILQVNYFSMLNKLKQ